MPAKPSIPVIISPLAGAHFKVGEKIKLQGYAIDLQQGMLGPDGLSWSSNLDGPLGAGSTRELALSEGTHTITLLVADSSASVTTTLVVEAPPPASQGHAVYLPLLAP